MAPSEPHARWLDLRDRLLRELCHDLNGRASALRGLAELQAMEGLAPGPSLDPAALIQEEADRLEELALNLQVLAARIEEPDGLLDLQPLVKRTARIVATLETVGNGGLEVLPAKGDPPPVRGAQALVSRHLLMAMEAVLSTARRLGAKGATVQVRGGEGGAEVRFVLAAGPPEEADPEEGGGMSTWDAPHPAWVSSWEDSGRLLRLRFPAP